MLHKSPTRFAEVNTDSPKLFNLPTRFAVVKNGLFEHLQAPYTLCGDQNGFSGVIQATKRFTVVITDSPIFYKPPTRFVEVNTD